VVGGDGTVHSAADSIIDSGVPVYHVPLGTENLFAREFSMSRDMQRLLGAIEHGTVRTIDVARSDGSASGPSGRFLIMCSVGADAGVVPRVSAMRNGSISHLSYAVPILAQVLRPRQPELSITVDGTGVVDREPGMAVVANSRQYAARIDPADRADPADGLLDVVFFRAETSLGLLNWVLSSRLRIHHQRDDLVYVRGRRIEIDAPGGPVPVQVDGEAPPAGRGGASRNGSAPRRFATAPVAPEDEPGAMRVLQPRRA